MILTGLVIGGVTLAAFAVLVIGIRGTERRFGLRDSGPSGVTEAFARTVLGVYVRRPTDGNRCQANDNNCQQVRR